MAETDQDQGQGRGGKGWEEVGNGGAPRKEKTR